jgi:hypothetical protein
MLPEQMETPTKKGEEETKPKIVQGSVMEDVVKKASEKKSVSSKVITK